MVQMAKVRDQGVTHNRVLASALTHRKQYRYEGQSVSVNECYACKRIIKCPYEIKKSQWKPLCADCAYKGVG